LIAQIRNELCYDTTQHWTTTSFVAERQPRMSGRWASINPSTINE